MNETPISKSGKKVTSFLTALKKNTDSEIVCSASHLKRVIKSAEKTPAATEKQKQGRKRVFIKFLRDLFI